jgi:cysteine desulfurase
MDAAATAKYRNIDDIVVDTMTTAMRDSWMNPSSLYAASVKDKINKCRKNIAGFIGARAEEIYFTSGASESNNWSIRGWVDNEINGFLHTNIITTPIEHKSILLAVQSNVLNVRVLYCDVDKSGLVSLESLEHLLYEHEYEPILVSISMANNEIGTIQNIKEISELVHKYGGVLHTDATQALGHIPIDVEELGVDMMSCSGHKISPALRGIGFIYKRNGVNIKPLIYGAQEGGIRGGTENTYGIIGLSKALEYCNFSYEVMSKMRDKRDYFINQLESKFGCKLNGHKKCRLLNNINVTFPQNISGESLLYMLDLSGIAVSTGSACNSKSIEKSHVLDSIGLSDSDAIKTIRFTLSDDITYQEIDKVIEEISKCLKLIEMEN